MVYSNTHSRIGPYIGTQYYPNGWFFKGELDELAIWDRELTPLEIIALCRPSNHLSVSKHCVSEKDITGSPNPANNKLNIKGSAKYDRVQIVSVNGKVVLEHCSGDLSGIDI